MAPERQSWFVGDVNYRTALSEALLRKVGSSINFINDRIIDRYAFNMGGYFRPTSVAQHTFPSIYIKNETVISYYTMSVGNSGSGTNSINFRVINASGTDLGNLFTTVPSIAQASIVNPLVGYDVKNSTEIRKVTTASYNNGVINPAYTTLPAGYELKMYVSGNGTNALNISVNLGLEAQS